MKTASSTKYISKEEEGKCGAFFHAFRRHAAEPKVRGRFNIIRGGMIMSSYVAIGAIGAIVGAIIGVVVSIVRGASKKKDDDEK